MVESMQASHEFLKQWLLWAVDEPTDVDAKIELFRKFRGLFDAGTDFIYSAWTRDERTLLGGSGLHFRVYEGGVEIGYWMDARQLRQGYATEITAALTRVAFEVEGVDRVEVHVDTRNEASFSVPKKLGFEHVATLPRSVKHPAGVGDRMIWMMLRERFTPSVELELFDAAGRPLERGALGS